VRKRLLLGFKNSNTSKVQSSKADKFRRSNFEIFVPIFLENGERWSTFLTSFESTREALHPKILWAKVQKQRSFGRSNSELYPDFLGIDELCSTYLTFLESPREGLQTPKILWTKVQKQKKFGRFCRSSDIPFSRSLVQSL